MLKSVVICVIDQINFSIKDQLKLVLINFHSVVHVTKYKYLTEIKHCKHRKHLVTFKESHQWIIMNYTCTHTHTAKTGIKSLLLQEKSNRISDSGTETPNQRERGKMYKMTKSFNVDLMGEMPYIDKRVINRRKKGCSKEFSCIWMNFSKVMLLWLPVISPKNMLWTRNVKHAYYMFICYKPKHTHTHTLTNTHTHTQHTSVGTITLDQPCWNTPKIIHCFKHRKHPISKFQGQCWKQPCKYELQPWK